MLTPDQMAQAETARYDVLEYRADGTVCAHLGYADYEDAEALAHRLLTPGVGVEVYRYGLCLRASAGKGFRWHAHHEERRNGYLQAMKRR